MSGDPKKNGDPGGDDLEERKTRVVVRQERADRTPPEPLAMPAEPERTEAPPEAGAGAVIGRTRLMGDHKDVPPVAGGGAPGGTPNNRMNAKTELIRGAGAGPGVQSDPVAGWLVVLKGPGRGGFRPIFVGMNSIGRDANQRVSLSFGDESISREEHAFITYDEESRTFYLQHGGKSNLVRLGRDPVLTPTELKPNDVIRIGKTTLLFVACCGPDFTWSEVLSA
jgi:hypothetical protein